MRPLSPSQRTQYIILTVFLLTCDFVTVFSRTFCFSLPYSLQTIPQIIGIPILLLDCSVAKQMPEKALHDNSEHHMGMKPNLAFL